MFNFPKGAGADGLVIVESISSHIHKLIIDSKIYSCLESTQPIILLQFLRDIRMKQF